MGTYIHFTEEQKRQASSVDLPEFLRRRGEKLLRSGREYRMASDRSITVRGNEWYDHETGKGGGPISFLQTRCGLSYPEAVSRLLEEQSPAVQTYQKPEERRKKFALPPGNREMRRVYAYLLRKRCISREVLTAFVRVGLIYEDAKYHNAVFVGKDEHGVVRHAHKRSTSDRTFRANAEGSDPRYSFHWTGPSDRLYVFEAPIDLLSFLTLHPEDWQRHSYVACCGTSSLPVLGMLERDTTLTHAALCFDNDPAGELAAERIGRLLEGRGITTERLCSLRKDWNEDLVEEPAFQGAEMTMSQSL